MIRYPQGKGLYIWIVDENWQQILFDLVDGNFNWACIKVADGSYLYNDNENMQKLINGLRDAGIEVWGWQYIYLNDGIREAEVAAERIAYYNLDGFVLDPEGEAKGKNVQAHNYAVTLENGTGVPIGLSSYRYPSYHPELPWDEFLAICDFHAPQVYWLQAHNPADQLVWSMSDLLALKDLPFVPAGCAFDDGDWSVTDEDVLEFYQKARELELPGIFYWAWHSARDAGVMADIKSQTWPMPSNGTDPDYEAILQEIHTLRVKLQAVEEDVKYVRDIVDDPDTGIDQIDDLWEAHRNQKETIQGLKVRIKDLEGLYEDHEQSLQKISLDHDKDIVGVDERLIKIGDKISPLVSLPAEVAEIKTLGEDTNQMIQEVYDIAKKSHDDTMLEKIAEMIRNWLHARGMD
jgi:hypothetical protein